ADDHEDERLDAVFGQLLAHLRADELVALERQRRRLAGGAGAVDARLAGFGLAEHLAALGLAQRLEDAVDEVGLLHVAAQRQPHQHVARGAEVLHLRLTKAHRLDGGARLADVGRLRIGDLDHRAAGELDRQMQPARREEDHRGEEGHRRDDVEHQRMPHERDVAADSEELHALGPYALGADGSASGFHTWPIDTAFSFFCRPYHRFTRPRENITAENIDVRMPSTCTTAKPRTGPEPKASSARPAIKVVTLESRMVANARS